MPAGRPPEYDPDKHPAECIAMGEKGMFAVEMATAWGVEPQTVSAWAREHKEFSSAYKRAKAARASWLLEQGRQGLFGSKDCQFNAVAWSMMMRYDGNNTDERTVDLPELSDCVTFKEMAECVIKAFGAGRLTPKEANTLTDIISKGAKVDEVTELRRMLEEIEGARKQGR